MSNKKFRPIPQSDFQITFKLDKKSVSEWLVHLSNYDGREACLQTLLLLQTINAAKMDVKTKTDLFNVVHDYLNHFISSLKNPCWDAGFPLTVGEREYAEAITWNYLTMSEGFFQLAKEATRKADELFSLYAAIKYMGLSQLHIAAIYCRPNDGFWKAVYEIYTHAEKKRILDDSINKNELKAVTINSLFKQILIFQICDTNQYRPRDMRTIFNFLIKICPSITLMKKPNHDQGLFMFDLNSDSPSINIRKNTIAHTNNVRYFSPVMAAKHLLTLVNQDDTWSGNQKSINTSLFLRVVKTLEQGQKRKYDRINDNNTASAVIGFYHIICLLRDIQPENPNIPQLRGQIANKLNIAATINKTADTNDLADSLIMNENVNDNVNTASESTFIKTLTILDNSVKGYSIQWQDVGLKVQIGDVFGLILGKVKKRLEIALIRRISLTSSADYRFGTEVIGFDSAAVYVSYTKDKKDGCWAVLVFGIVELNEPDTIIYPINRFNPGEKVYLFGKDDAVGFYLLTKELYSTTSISHVELSLFWQDESESLS